MVYKLHIDIGIIYPCILLRGSLLLLIHSYPKHCVVGVVHTAADYLEDKLKDSTGHIHLQQPYITRHRCRLFILLLITMLFICHVFLNALMKG